MNLPRFFSRTAWALLAATCVQGAAMAQQDFPARAVKMVVANGPGSVPDLLARQVGHLVGKEWKQAVVVENKGAAGGVSAVDAVVKAQPDGYTLLVGGDSAITIMPNVQRNLPYDVKNDLVPVTKLGQSDFVLVANSRKGFKTLQDFVSYAKAHPGKLDYASPGNGSPHHLAMELFKNRTGTSLTHIPYKGAAPAVADVMGGQVPCMFLDLPAGLPMIQSGKVRALAIGTAKRIPTLPNVPTLAELGVKDSEVYAFQGILGPKAMPPAIVQRLNGDLQKALKDPEVVKRMADFGMEALPGTPEQFHAMARAEAKRWGEVIKAAGTKLD